MLDKIILRKQIEKMGGEGSGNFGHAGRPGEVGGSGEGGKMELLNGWKWLDDDQDTMVKHSAAGREILLFQKQSGKFIIQHSGSIPHPRPTELTDFRTEHNTLDGAVASAEMLYQFDANK